VSGKIFINYRRGDEPRFTNALFKRLEQEFGRGAIMMDWESGLDGGDRFAGEVAAQAAQAGLLLVVIGPRWAERLAMLDGDPEDFVRIEIEAALANGKPAIPLLVADAPAPQADELPAAIRGLVRKGAVPLRPDNFDADVGELVSALRKAFGGGASRAAPAAPRPAPQPARQRPPEPAQDQPEPSGKPGEFANWVLIRESGDPDKFRSHLARYSGGPTEREARKRLEALVWNHSAARHSADGLRRYLREFPAGEHVQAAMAEIVRLEEEPEPHRAGGSGLTEEEAWAEASDSGKLRDLEDFLAEWPDGEYADDAREMLTQTGGGGKGGVSTLLIMLGVILLVLGMVVVAGMKF
jgi:hypothetical protein